MPDPSANPSPQNAAPAPTIESLRRRRLIFATATVMAVVVVILYVLLLHSWGVLIALFPVPMLIFATLTTHRQLRALEASTPTSPIKER